MGTFQDVTLRKQTEARTSRDKMRTEFLLELHRSAPYMSDQELYDHVLDRAVRLTDSAIGFFHQVSEDESSIILTTWNQEARKHCSAAFNTHYPLKEAGNWVDCVREKRPIVYNDYAHSPHQRGLPEGHTPVRRFMSIPVIQDGRVRIIFGVGNKPSDYTEDDAAQLQVVANELHKIMVQRSAENQLRQLSRAVEQSPVSVIITDTSGAIEYVNPRFTQTSGYRLEDIRGQNPRVLKSGEMPPEHYRRLWRTIHSGEPWHGELRSRKKNGEIHWESASISPITDAAGNITHFVAVKEDITNRKQLESQLRQAQKLEAIGQLAGGVAHDFNNILAAIMMHLGLLQLNDSLDAETRQALTDLDAEARRAASLTRQLLMFSRRSVLAIRPLDLNDTVANLLKMLTRLIGENIQLNFESGSHLPTVKADAGMLEQVLLNLVVNARDAMPEGGRITISTSAVEFVPADVAVHPERRPGRFLCLSVADTGSGMADTTLKRIFEPFFTTKEAGRGTGLGLATVHGIVAQHAGWIEVQSALDQGTTFRVLLPATVETVAKSTEPAPSEPLPHGQETILLVEDEVRVRRMVGRSLRALGYQVHEAANGQEAMKLWQLHGPQIDLLFTDMVMPEGMTGLELTERLQALKPGLKAIISSGYSAEIVQAGVPDKAGILYLPKPYETRILANTVRNVLQKKP